MAGSASSGMVNLNVRLTHDMIARLDDLVPVGKAAPELSMVSEVTRSHLLRLACQRGLALLEHELRPQPRLPLDD